MSHTIQLNESDIRNMVKQAIYEYYSVSEGRLGKALGTAALGGMLAFGNMANAKPANNNPSYSQVQAQTNQEQKNDFEPLVKEEWAWINDDYEFEGEYKLVHHTLLDAKTMRENFTERKNTLLFNPNTSVKEAEVDGMYKITINEVRSEKQITIYTIYIKDNAFKITAKVSDKLLPTIPNNSNGLDLLRKRTKTIIANIAQIMVQEKDLRSEFDF